MNNEQQKPLVHRERDDAGVNDGAIQLGDGAKVPNAKPSRKKMWLIGLGAMLGVMLVGTGAYAYMYSQPEKVVMDALMSSPNEIKADVTFKNLDTDGVKINKVVANFGMSKDFAVDTNATIDLVAQGKDIALTGTALLSKDREVYFKIDGISTAAKKLANGQQLPEALTKMIAKAEGVWVKVDSAKMKELKLQKMISCMIDTPRKYENDKKAIQEEVDMLKKHKIVTIKKDHGLKDGMMSYDLAVNKDELIKYLDNSNNTTIGKATKSCMDEAEKELEKTDTANIMKSSEESKKETRDFIKDTDFEARLWADAVSHDMKRMVLDMKVKNAKDLSGEKIVVNVDMTFKYTPKFEVKLPTTVTSVDDWVKNIQSTFGQ